MKALVTGSTGFIGRRLCSRLQANASLSLALSRDGSSLADGSKTRSLDLEHETLDACELQGVDTVFYLAGIAHRHGRGLPYEAVNNRAALQLARQARDAGVSCFIYLSSVKAMGEGGDSGARSEEEVVPAVDGYGLSKWRAEQALRNELGNSGMAIYIVRPALVYGHGVRGNLRLLARAINWGLPRPPELGGRSMVSREDLVELLLLAAERAQPGVHTWIAADGEIYTTRRLYDALRRAAGKGAGRSWLPIWVWQAGLALLDALPGARDSLWQTVFGSELYDNRRAREEAGWQPHRTFEDVLHSGETHRC